MTSPRALPPDLELGQLGQPGGVPPETSAHAQHGGLSEPERRMINLSGSDDARGSGSHPSYDSHEKRKDFDDSANALWSLYGKEAKSHDEARIQSLKDDMDGVLIFAGLFSAVLTAFVVQSVQNLQANPAQQSVYYQQQSVQMLAQISQQIASLAPQLPVNSTLPSPYPTFSPSSSDLRVNICWLMSLVCSLSAALLATLVQQWVRVYMRVFLRYSNLLKIARIRQYLFDGVERWHVLVVAEVVPALIHISLFLFFLGLCDSMLKNNTAVGVVTTVLTATCGVLYLCTMIAPVVKPQSPYRNPFSGLLWHLIRKIRRRLNHNNPPGDMHKPANMEEAQEQLAMDENDERKGRDVRAIRWLVNNINENIEMEPFILAIPGSFNTEWGRKVWEGVSNIPEDGHPDTGLGGAAADQATNTDRQVSTVSVQVSSPEGSTLQELCWCVRYLFETCTNHAYFINEEVRRRRMHACVDAAASLVCYTKVKVVWFGEVGKVLSELGEIERMNEPPTGRSNPSFTTRWACLSLVATQRMMDISLNRLEVLARYAVSGIARFQPDYGLPDVLALKSAHRIDESLKTARGRVEDLRQAFEPWDLDRTEDQVKEILCSHETQISALVRIKTEIDRMEGVDLRISLLRDAMDEATHGLMRQLPGASFSESSRSGPTQSSEVYNLHDTTPVMLQLIFPGQQLQDWCTLGLKLRDVMEGRSAEGYREILEILRSIDKIPVPLRQLDNMMKRQLWRLQDLRDGDGLGFTIELFFLALRRLLATSSWESNSVFYVGTFEVITSQRMDKEPSLGTQQILLDLICDLVIRGRGIFSDFSYPVDITDKLLELMKNMLSRQTGSHPHIDDAVQELRVIDPERPVDMGLRHKTLRILIPFQTHNTSS